MTDSRVSPIEWSSATSSSLLARALADDPQAWDALLEKYGPRVYRWARSQGLQSHDAQDISQAVFVVVALKLNTVRLDREEDTFRGWLRRVTQNKIRDWYKSQENLRLPTGGTDHHLRLTELSTKKDELPTSNAANRLAAECEEAIRRVQSRCKEQTWQMFWQVAVEDRLPADVAVDFGVTVNAVYLAKTRVTRRLKEACERLH